MKRRHRCWVVIGLVLGMLSASIAAPACAQTLLALDDEYGIPYGAPLEIEAVGVLANDTLDGENAGENGATAELVADVQHGTLILAADGSFTYTPGPGFDGSDGFTYNAVFGAITAQASVTLSACSGGPQRFACWREAAYLAKAAELGFESFREGFEDDAAWGSARSPITSSSVTSRGIEWRSNHPDPPASNAITTGPGPARTGQWAIFDLEHGYATGTPAECDVDVPPAHCLFHDGFSGTRTAGGRALHGVGGYLDESGGANVAIVLDGTDLIPFGHIGGGGHQFFGVVDASENGFRDFEIRETDGKVGQARFIFGDDFVFLLGGPGEVPAVSGAGLLAVAVLLVAAASRRLR